MMDPNRDDPLEEDPRTREEREPPVVPAISSEQPVTAAGIGLAYVERTEDAAADNDQESHTSPSDNDGETVPRDEVVDQTGG
jgi:hypothetical protein